MDEQDWKVLITDDKNECIVDMAIDFYSRHTIFVTKLNDRQRGKVTVTVKLL